MDRHDTRDSDTGQFSPADVFDMSRRIPKKGSAARSEPDEFSSLTIDLTATGDAIRVASGGSGVDDFNHPPAGDAGGGADYIRDRSKTVEAQNAAKAPSSEVRRARENDWEGPRPERDRYPTDWRGRDGSSGW
jgi:hypothetical protein